MKAVSLPVWTCTAPRIKAVWSVAAASAEEAEQIIRAHTQSLTPLVIVASGSSVLVGSYA